MDDFACKVQKKIEIDKQEIAVDQFQLRFRIKKVTKSRTSLSPSGQQLHMSESTKRQRVSPVTRQPQATEDLFRILELT